MFARILTWITNWLTSLFSSRGAAEQKAQQANDAAKIIEAQRDVAAKRPDPDKPDDLLHRL